MAEDDILFNTRMLSLRTVLARFLEPPPRSSQGALMVEILCLPASHYSLCHGHHPVTEAGVSGLNNIQLC